MFWFSKHVWGINYIPLIAIHAFERLIDKNLYNASPLILIIIGIQMSCLLLLILISRELMLLFESRGFELRKLWANHLVKPVLLSILKYDLGFNIQEIDFGSNPMADFTKH